jgi:hypothetical protein
MHAREEAFSLACQKFKRVAQKTDVFNEVAYVQLFIKFLLGFDKIPIIL